MIGESFGQLESLRAHLFPQIVLAVLNIIAAPSVSLTFSQWTMSGLSVSGNRLQPRDCQLHDAVIVCGYRAIVRLF
jgi:hypothetical protein